MTDPTLTVTIDRTSLSLSPLAFSGRLDGTDLGIVRYIPPAMQARLTYAPDSADIDGSEAVSAAWQQTFLGIDWVPVDAADEAAIQTARAEVLAAIGQFAYTVTTTVNGAPGEVWSAQRGSMQLGGSDGRTLVDLKYRVPVYAVTIPVYPLPEAP